MTELNTISNDLIALVQDAGRLKAVEQICGLGLLPDSDFDTLIEMIRSQSKADTALIAIVKSDQVLYQACAGHTTQISSELENAAIACLVEQNGYCLQSSPDKETGQQEGNYIWGRPIMVADQAVGSLCLIDKSGALQTNATNDESFLDRSARLIASMYELKQSARARSMSDFDLSRANVRYALALKAGRVATWSWDRDLQTIECDPLMREMLGLQEIGTVTLKHLFKQVDHEDFSRIRRNLENAATSEEDVTVEFRARGTGCYIWALGHVFERDAEGNPKKILGVAIDLTQSKQSEAKTRLLLREVNHRVKNMLAILQSLASQTLRHSQSPEHFTRSFSGRLAALATSHGLLSDLEWEDIDLVSLIQTQVKPYASHYSEQVTIESQPVTIDADTAVALGLVIHELATNAMRYGALSVRDGSVKISTQVISTAPDKKKLIVEWQETGGPIPSSNQKPGFGSLLIEHSLKKIIGSDVSIMLENSGLTATINIPI